MENTSSHQYKKSTLISVGADLKKSDPKLHYVDNQALYAALLERRALAPKEDGSKHRVSEFIGKCFQQIAENLSYKYQFRNYPYRQDMVQDAVIAMLKGVDSFDPQFGKNPFSYFTQTAYYSFLGTIDEEKSELAVKFKGTLEKIALQDVSEHDEDYHEMMAEENLPDTSLMADFIAKYEISRARKKPAKEKSNPLEEFME